MPRRFAGRVAIVTGAASGIGLAIAERFTEEGASVAMIDQESNNEAGGFVVADVSSETAVKAAIEGIAKRTKAIDHLVNCAGIVLVKGVEECSTEEWDHVMAVNLRSIFLTVKYSLPWLRRSDAASIVNIGSVSSFVAQQNTPAYVASKGAVLMLSKALALDLASDGIRVNCVCPGITDTPMLRTHLNTTLDPEATLHDRLRRVPLRRALSPREVADSVLYLAGPESSGITGTSLVVDAGYTAAAEWTQL